MSEKYAWEGRGLDESAARELSLWIDNDSDLYRQQYVPILKNLTAKKARGVYDHQKAAVLFGYLAESGAKRYTKEFDAPDASWSAVFPKKLRDAVAEELRDRFEEEYDNGAYAEFVPLKYRAKGAPKRKSARIYKPSGFQGIR